MKVSTKESRIKDLWNTYKIQPEKVRNELSFIEWVTIDSDWLVAERERLAIMKGAC